MHVIASYLTAGSPTGMIFPLPSSSGVAPTGYQYTNASVEVIVRVNKLMLLLICVTMRFELSIH